MRFDTDFFPCTVPLHVDFLVISLSGLVQICPGISCLLLETELSTPFSFVRWTDTWGPEGDGDDSCDAAADTEDQDQDGGCISQNSPGHDDKGEDPGAPQELDAAAQNARLRSKQDAQPNTCVYVGFLGWWVTEKDLQDYFSPYGQLASVRVSEGGWGYGRVCAAGGGIACFPT